MHPAQPRFAQPGGMHNKAKQIPNTFIEGLVFGQKLFHETDHVSWGWSSPLNIWSQNPEFLYANCREENFNPKFSRGELKIEVLLSNRWRGELKIEVLLSSLIQLILPSYCFWFINSCICSKLSWICSKLSSIFSNDS